MKFTNNSIQYKADSWITKLKNLPLKNSLSNYKSKVNNLLKITIDIIKNIIKKIASCFNQNKILDIPNKKIINIKWFFLFIGA